MPDKKTWRKIKVLALSSGGGHWVQLLRVRPAFGNCDVVFATVRKGYRTSIAPGANFRLIPPVTRWNKIAPFFDAHMRAA